MKNIFKVNNFPTCHLKYSELINMGTVLATKNRSSIIVLKTVSLAT